MAIDSDVLVIGGGLAGATAALAAARDAGTVRLVSAKKSTLRHASGLIDVLGYRPDGSGPLAAPFDAIDDLPDDHPYAVVGAEGIRAGLALFDDAVDGYRGGHTDRNALIPTHGGTVKPTARYPASVAPGLASDDRPTLLVGFDGLSVLDAGRSAAHLAAAGVPFEVRGVSVEFPLDLDADAGLTRYARALEADEDGARTGLIERIDDAIEASDIDPDRVGLPAVLGEAEHGRVWTEITDAVGVDVFEVPTGPPSLPGMRLESELYDALDDAGVRIETGNPVIDHDAEDGRVTSVTVDRTGAAAPYTASRYVLATGGLVGKGIEADRESVSEPLFDCHVPHPEDRYEWSEPEAFGDHDFARFGVVPDDALRPTDADGDPEYENLHAAGGVLGGADPAATCAAAGISIATGRAAGTIAGEHS